MKIMLYHYTKNRDLLETLPDTFSNVCKVSEVENLIDQTNFDFDMLQAELDNIVDEIMNQPFPSFLLDMLRMDDIEWGDYHECVIYTAVDDIEQVASSW